MRTTPAVAAALIAAAMLLTAGCSGSSDTAEAKPRPTTTVTTTAPAPEPLTEEETTAQCTQAVAEAAPGWDDWNIDLENWKNDPRTPEVCKTLDNLAYNGAYLDGLDTAAACGTPDALPGRC